jgi:hypothetical protein
VPNLPTQLQILINDDNNFWKYNARRGSRMMQNSYRSIAALLTTLTVAGCGGQSTASKTANSSQVRNEGPRKAAIAEQIKP